MSYWRKNILIFVTKFLSTSYEIFSWFKKYLYLIIYSHILSPCFNVFCKIDDVRKTYFSDGVNTYIVTIAHSIVLRFFAISFEMFRHPSSVIKLLAEVRWDICQLFQVGRNCFKRDICSPYQKNHWFLELKNLDLSIILLIFSNVLWTGICILSPLFSFNLNSSGSTKLENS